MDKNLTEFIKEIIYKNGSILYRIFVFCLRNWELSTSGRIRTPVGASSTFRRDFGFFQICRNLRQWPQEAMYLCILRCEGG